MWWLTVGWDTPTHGVMSHTQAFVGPRKQAHDLQANRIG